MENIVSVMETSIGADLHILRNESQVSLSEYDGRRVINYLVLNKDQAARLVQDRDVKVLGLEEPTQVKCHIPAEAAAIAYSHALYGAC